MSRFAAIDVGTNSVLLTVVEAAGGSLRTLAERAEITRLGQGVDATGRLSEAGIARTLEVLGAYARDLRELGADRVACVATSAARDAANGPDFLTRVRALGLSPEIIDGDREAGLSFLAARRDFGGEDAPLAVLDVGGGSTEVVFGAGSRPTFHVSLQVGSVRLYERLLRTDPPSFEERLAVRAGVDEALAVVPPPPPGAKLVGVAGTLTTLATLALGLAAYDAERVHGAELSLADVSTLTNRLWSLPVAARRQLPGLQPGRADVLPVGALIVESVLYRLRLDRVTVSDRGVRWGLLYELAGLPVKTPPWFFELAARPYELLVYQKAWRDHCARMVDRLPPRGGGNRLILDVGCGPGVSALAMLAASPGDRVVGLDLAWQMLQRAAARRQAEGVSPERLPLLRGDVTQLPFGDGRFDGVTGHSFLYLVPDQPAALAEIRRVLRPGGKLVLLEPAAGSMAVPVLRSFRHGLRFATSMVLWRAVSGGVGQFSASRLQHVLGDAGFSRVSVEPTLDGVGLLAEATR